MKKRRPAGQKGVWLGRMKQQKTEAVSWEGLSPDDRMKYEIAEELGLLEKVKKEGWKALSAKETGRIGGLMTRRKRAQQKKDKETGQ